MANFTRLKVNAKRSTKRSATAATAVTESLDFTTISTTNVDFIALFVSQSEQESYQNEFHSGTNALLAQQVGVWIASLVFH